MGCGGSKLDELEAVALCRERSNLLSQAISFRYALADSTVAYARSLSTAGESLRNFLSSLPGESSPSPLLPLPAQRKGDPLPQAVGGGREREKERTIGTTSTAASSSGGPVQARHSHSGSHIHFSDDDSDEDDDDDDSHIHSTDSSPIHHHPGHNDSKLSHFTYNYASAPPPAAVSVEQRPAVAPTAVHYARNTPAPAAIYERHPQSPESVHYGAGLPPSYSGYPSSSYGAYPEQSEQSYSYTPYQPNYAAYGGGGFFGGPASPPPSYLPYGSGIGGDRSPPPPRTPPPPPSPPKTSTWDFLNPFGGYESFAEEIRYPYTPSRSSREVREEEGIPDLEDEEHEVVKEAYVDGGGKFSTSTSASTTPESISKASGKGDGSGIVGEDLHYSSGKLGRSGKVGEDPYYTSAKSGKSGEASSSSAAEVEAHVKDKNVVADEIKQAEPQPQQQQHNVRAVVAPTRYHDMSEVVEEINKQFDRASKSFDEVKKMLEVGKIQYNQKSSVIEVSTRIMCGLPSSSHSKDQFLEFEEDNVMSSGNLSSTLRKLYLWEQKLYEEVKVEEKMRIVLERECEHLRRLDERGAEATKIESTQIFIRKLSTKIRIAIQVVESISNKISKLRDEELWPQINEFIQGMMRMWRVMLECHRIQCQAISNATIASGGRLNETHIVATKNLELDLLDLTTCFSAWIGTQKTFVKSLNCWLLKGLRYVPEETDDGVAPFSPGRLGAPPVFVICNYWSQTLERISEREALDAMKVFALNILDLWEQHHIEQRQRLKANQDMDKALRAVEIEEQQMRRAVEVKNKRLELVSGQGGLMLSGQAHRGQTVEMSSLHLNLRQFFEAMENFTANSLKAYEELHARSEEEKTASENSRAR